MNPLSNSNVQLPSSTIEPAKKEPKPNENIRHHSPEVLYLENSAPYININLKSLPNGRTVIHPEQRPQQRKITDLTQVRKNWVQQNSVALVSTEEVENLEYRVVPKEADVIRKLQQEKKAAIDHGQEEAKRYDHEQQQKFIKTSKDDSSFENKQLGNGKVNAIAQKPGYFVSSYIEDKKVDVDFDTLEKVPNAAVAHCIGARATMEDSHIAEHFSATINGRTEQIQMTGVFDGHRSSKWANYATKHLVQHLKQEFERFNNPETPKANIWNAIKIAFVNLDRTMKEDYPDDKSGTTANIAIKIGKQLWIANLGDSRAILVDSNSQSGYTQLSEDATLLSKKYNKSLKNRGGVAYFHGLHLRVFGSLAVARSFGDNHSTYGGVISARPKITCYEEDEFKGNVLVQVCDGVTNVATSESIGHAVRNDLNNDYSLAVTAAKLIRGALEASSQDNLTAIITRL